jgi:hypothetical protein
MHNVETNVVSVAIATVGDAMEYDYWLLLSCHATRLAVARDIGLLCRADSAERSCSCTSDARVIYILRDCLKYGTRVFTKL